MLSRLTLSLLLFLALASSSPVRAQEVPTISEPVYYKAKVTRITPTSTEGQSDTVAVTLTIAEGTRTGNEVVAFWSNDQQRSRSFRITEGQSLIISCATVDTHENCDIMEQQRTKGLISLLILFLVVVWLVTKRNGLKAIGAMLIGLLVILFVIIPLILKGWPPLTITILAGAVILIPSIYLSHGFNTKSHIALIGIGVAVCVIGILSLLFSDALALMGSTGEETNYLNPAINLRAILLSAILLGALGVVDDIAMTQVSIVNELYHSNKKLTTGSLFIRAMEVGKDHVASVVNTLFLAYAGVSLPLLILMQQNDLPFWVAINYEPLATEVMRTVVGTIGLILVVPLTTYIAAQAITRYPEKFPAEAHHHH